MRRLLDWLDDRTGIRGLVHEALYERIPGGARWRYVWGSTLVFTFFVQLVTGLFLWMAYSPSALTAWESVYYIQHQMQGGWLLRGVHHFTAQAMVVLMVLHLLQVVVDGAYRAPREINFWLGLVLMQLVLGLALTGYLLPWDQKGYWATRVATNLMGVAPGGATAQSLVVGGADYGHHTLTRFFALHAGVLPGLLALFLVLHVYLFRRHGIKAHQPIKRPDATFWPDQVLKDAVACLAVLTVVLVMVLKPALVDGAALEARRLGAELSAPADPANSYNAARPEWYFLFLFQFLKYFPSEMTILGIQVPGEAIGAIVLPGAVMLVFVLMPLVARLRWGHAFNVTFLLLLLFAGVVPLTYLAWRADHRGPEAAGYAQAVADAQEDTERAIELAQSPRRIPPEGAARMMHDDPHMQGKRLFKKNCAACHDPLPATTTTRQKTPLALAAKLRGFASRDWVRGLLDPSRIAGPDYFGRSRHRGGEMVEFVKGDLQDRSLWKQEDIENVVLALSAEAQLPEQADSDRRDARRIAAGRKRIADTDTGCAACHRYGKAADGSAPDLSGYGSKAWMVAFISDPHAERFYGDEEQAQRMPSFAPHPPGEPGNTLTRDQIELIAGYLRGDYRRLPP